jgi:dTDP-4-dehydrorhamnose reductase
MYREDDERKPVNHYGWTKVAAEDAVREADGNTAIARLPLVMGLPAFEGGNSFLAKMLAAWKRGESVGVPDNEVRTPVDVVTAARALLELCELDFQDTVHIAGNERLNRFDYVKRIAERFGYSQDWVEANDPSSIPNRAPRPLDVSLDNHKARELFRTPMLDVEPSADLVREVSASWFAA